MNITLQLPDTIDESNLAFILRDVARAVEDPQGSVQQGLELMDGSYPVDTDYGTVFILPDASA